MLKIRTTGNSCRTLSNAEILNGMRNTFICAVTYQLIRSGMLIVEAHRTAIDIYNDSLNRANGGE